MALAKSEQHRRSSMLAGICLVYFGDIGTDWQRAPGASTG